LRVDNVAESLKFYSDLLGLEQLPRPDFGFPGAWLLAGDVQVHLLEATVNETTGTPPSQINNRTNHVAFSVSDLEGFRSLFEEHGYEVLEGPSGIPQLFVQDPSGNVIELTAFMR
jgi:catechol 2,3-dioxygenase-like lactoylglutathione lyase family enzyme